MEGEGGVDHVGAHLPDQEGELVPGGVQVIRQDVVVDGEEGLLAGEAHGVRSKVTLEPGVDGEASRRGVHAGDVLDVVDVLGG